MAVLRIHKKQQNFVILDKTCLNDQTLSWGAKGLHAYLISLPDDWKVQVSDLQKRARNGRDAVRGLLSELEQAGYIQKATCRDDVSGRFGGVEYLVLEIPEPEKPSLVNPETGNPLPENPTLININKISNKELNNKTAAASHSTSIKTLNAKIQSEKAAAVVSSQADRHELMSVGKTYQGNNPIDFLSQEDALIDSQLTQPQKDRVRMLVKSLSVSQKDVLIEEIEFCLLNPKHFTACGKDFSRKLNAIRGVILRGGWQTPAGMIQERSTVQNSNNLAVRQLENELREAQAEAVHFKRLLTTAKEHTRAHFETIIYQAQNKIHDLEERIRGFLSQQQEILC
jgi:hypothetical protein